MSNAASLFVVLLCVFSGFADARVAAVDGVGREITLEKPAERIVALAPHSVENLFSAGAGDRLVGVVSYSDYPAVARELPQVGDFRSWSLEAIVALQPDLVVMWGSGSGLQRVQLLEGVGIPVFVSEIKRLTDLPETIRALSTLAGTSSVGSVEAARIEAAIHALGSRYSNARRLSVFYQIWNAPLQTLNGQHLVSDVIELCGGENVFGDAPFIAPKISIESVLAADPDVIVASGMGATRPEWLDDWRAYRQLGAVRNDALLSVNPDHMQRASARILLGAQALCDMFDELRDRL
ncbi:MAG: cobalamin-binding protein [Congregibacter sp.]